MAEESQQIARPLSILAFLYLDEVESGVFRGGLLATDSGGKPLEFHCTSAIRPNTLQKTLYGDALRPHMAVDLTAKLLYGKLQQKPDAFLVWQREFLEFREDMDENIPVLLVAKQGATAAGDAAGNDGGEILSNEAGKFEALTITPHWKHKADAGFVLPDMSKFFAKFDLAGPFERIHDALKMVHSQGATPAN